jgi:hypothetical protein
VLDKQGLHNVFDLVSSLCAGGVEELPESTAIVALVKEHRQRDPLYGVSVD